VPNISTTPLALLRRSATQLIVSSTARSSKNSVRYSSSLTSRFSTSCFHSTDGLRNQLHLQLQHHSLISSKIATPRFFCPALYYHQERSFSTTRSTKAEADPKQQQQPSKQQDSMSSTTNEPKRFPTLYPPIQPYDTGRLKVSDIHELYYEQVGNPNVSSLHSFQREMGSNRAVSSKS